MATLSPALIAEVLLRDKRRCRHCKITSNLHPHHCRFKSHGGKDVASNLLTLCASCHLQGVHLGNLEIYTLDGVRATGSNDVNTTQKLHFVRRGKWKPT